MAEKKSTTLYQALVAAQKEMKNPPLDGRNPHFKSKFASLKATCDAAIPVCNKHGLAVFQPPRPFEGGVACETVLVHTSGELMSLGTFGIPVGDNNPQHYVAGLTYCRRAALSSALGLVGDEDTGGNDVAPKDDRPAKGAQKKGKNFRFLESIKPFKKAIGDKRYYQVIGGHGYEHADEIESREHQIAVYKELEMVANAVEEME